jgi:hypothetical protein
MDAATGNFVPLSGASTVVNATITPQTGPDRQDTGGIVSYTLPATITAQPGDFVLFVQVTFPNNYVLTEDRRVCWSTASGKNP